MNNLLFLNIGAPEMIIIFMFIIAPLLLTGICLIDIVRSDFKDSTTKLLWALIVLFAPVIGSIIYLVIGRNQKISSQSSGI